MQFLDDLDPGGQVATREALASIARSIANRLPREAQIAILQWIDEVFDIWKFARAAPDGTVEVEPSGTFLSDLLPAMPGELPRARTRRVRVSELKPEQCGGPSVKSGYDLLVRLYLDHLPSLKPAIDSIGLDMLAALLVQRDYRTMPLDSLALAVNHFWMLADLRAKALAREIGENEARRAKQRADAQASGALANATLKRARDTTIERAGLDYFRKFPNATNKQAAAYILKTAKENQWEGFSNVSMNAIARSLSKVKERARDSLAKQSQSM
jgi:hypothetical protein